MHKNLRPNYTVINMNERKNDSILQKTWTSNI